MATKKLKYNARVSLDRFYKGLGIIILITPRQRGNICTSRTSSTTAAAVEKYESLHAMTGQ